MCVRRLCDVLLSVLVKHGDFNIRSYVLASGCSYTVPSYYVLRLIIPLLAQAAAGCYIIGINEKRLLLSTAGV